MGVLDRVKSLLGGDASAQAGDAPSGVAEPEPAPVAPAATAPNLAAEGSEVEQVLRTRIAELSDGALTPDAIDGGAFLFDQGYLDSLSSITLLTFIEERFGVRVKEVDLVGRLGSLDALAEHVARTRAEGGSGA